MGIVEAALKALDGPLCLWTKIDQGNALFGPGRLARQQEGVMALIEGD
jgi:hypothetical protein